MKSGNVSGLLLNVLCAQCLAEYYDTAAPPSVHFAPPPPGPYDAHPQPYQGPHGHSEPAVEVEGGPLKLIYAGSLLDMETGLWRRYASVTLNGSRIQRVDDGFIPKPADVEEVLDLRHLFLLPGLVDLSVDLERDPDRPFPAQQGEPAAEALKAAERARRMLFAGFTTVRATRGSRVTLALRDAVDAGLVEGPRIVASGQRLSPTGGGGDPLRGKEPKAQRLWEGDAAVCDGADECRKEARRQLRDDVDLLSVAGQGGVERMGRGPGVPLSEEELAAIVAVARSAGVEVTAEGTTDEEILRLLRAGVRSVEKCHAMTEEVQAALRDSGALCLPSLLASHRLMALANHSSHLLPAEVAERVRAEGEGLVESFRSALSGGVGLGLGSGAGLAPHAQAAKELVLMVGEGMTALEALKGATLLPARLLGLRGSLGSVQEGKVADLLGLTHDPIANISAVLDVDFVMRGGRTILAATVPVTAEQGHGHAPAQPQQPRYPQPPAQPAYPHTAPAYAKQ